MLITHRQIDDIRDFLASVTGEWYEQKIDQNDTENFLLVWQSDSHVDYLIHIMKRANRYRFALAVQRNADIETRFDRLLSQNEFERLINDPRQCVIFLVGQCRGDSRRIF